MGQKTVAPFGSWLSPVTPEMVASAGVMLSSPWFDGKDVYWLEGRPTEGGRCVLVQRTPGGTRADVTPRGFNVRTRVHEYGGGAFLISKGTVYFSHFADQRLYRQEPGAAPVPITPEPSAPAALRYADGRLTPDGSTLICVRERHGDGRDPINELVALPSDGSAEPHVLVDGHDFVSSPRISPDGRRVAWLTWDHPRMPWDGTQLWVAFLTPEGVLCDTHWVAGGAEESIYQPEWSPEGVLHFASDRSGWWNLYRHAEDGTVEALTTENAEFIGSQWNFGTTAYAFVADGRIACLSLHNGRQRLRILSPDTGLFEAVESPFCRFGSHLVADGRQRLWYVGSRTTEPAALVEHNLETGTITTLQRSSTVRIDPGHVSVARAIEFPTGDDLTAHAYYYPPANRDYEGPEGERPPLLVMSHGGPTAWANAEFQPQILYWTSRGIGVVDVNYGGSIGYGREYRERLRGRWGIVDTVDCINAANFLAGTGDADEDRMAIRGGSAGGYTTLCALVFYDVFNAGASYYGVADAEALARDTHKFESRYLDGLIGPYPEAAETYRERSPVHFAEGLSCPLIIFQGLEDPVVPPAQSEVMVAALESKGLAHAYVPFEGEQHGFRKAANIQRALEAELYFYGRVFGFEPADHLEPVEIPHLD